MREVSEFKSIPGLSIPRLDWGINTPRVVLHVTLFALTAVSIIVFGVILPSVQVASIRQLPAAIGLLLQEPAMLSSGMSYACTLLAILLAHELGHYIACRYYGVRATLPYFIPAPTLVGTFGAFIRIKDMIRTRRALFDIGIAGPLAGFVIALPASFIGMLVAQPAPPPPIGASVTVFQDPLLFILLQEFWGFPKMVYWNPVYFAAWVGLLATSLNLLPVGQLDGGHVVYALIGKRGHRWAAWGIFALMTALAIVAYQRYQWAGWFVYVILLGLLLGLKHPPLADEQTPIGRSRIVIGIIGLIVFILTFMPFPISFS
ncbi:MAG: site-2 protease family protein [Acidobacteria bacterium]|nr:site-2 protease family protein [Acidobacteriota bacterium]